MRRKIGRNKVISAVKELALRASFEIEPSAERLLKKAMKDEVSRQGKIALGIILENLKIAREKKIPICQDTGLSIFFVEVGRELRLDFDLEDALNQALREATVEGYLRRSVAEPISRENTGDNSPGIVHLRITEGNRLRIKVLFKGAGSENKSQVRMLTPGEGIEGIKKFALETVEMAGGQACPPFFIGIGIGGDLELCALLAKKALAREAGKPSKDQTLARLEREILKEVNCLGIGPSGLGGKITCVSVAAEKAYCHIASLPVAVNLQCWAHRSGEVVL